MQIFADNKRIAVIRPIPVELGGYVNIDEITFPEDPCFCRNAMAKLMVDIDTGTAGKSIRQKPGLAYCVIYFRVYATASLTFCIPAKSDSLVIDILLIFNKGN